MSGECDICGEDIFVCQCFCEKDPLVVDCISDLHGYYPEMNGGDLLIVAGDLTASDKTCQLIEFGEWLHKQNYKKKIVIGGNHDNLLHKGHWDVCSPKKYGWDFDYLCDCGTKFEGLRIWGSPWTKKFENMNPKCMAFTVDTDQELEKKFFPIPDNVDILITHSPPFGILDKTKDGKNVGSKFLRASLVCSFTPKLCVFGHIHESYGEKIFKNSITCVNASHVNEKYEPVNKPIRIVI